MPNTPPSTAPLKALLPTLALALVLLLAPAAFAETTTVHFFVVPAAVPAQKIPALNDFLVKTAGGFTSARSHGRGPGSPSKKIRLDNWSYTVAADHDLSREIMDYLKENCGLPSVFMLVWEAERPGH